MSAAQAETSATPFQQPSEDNLELKGSNVVREDSRQPSEERLEVGSPPHFEQSCNETQLPLGAHGSAHSSASRHCRLTSYFIDAWHSS